MIQNISIARTILRVAIAAILTTATAPPANAAPSDDPSGTWLTEDGRARVRIERCGAKLEQICGYVVWMKEALDAKGQALKDLQNPDSTRRSRPLLGHQLIMGLTLAADERFQGQIYNAENGKSYAISLWREAAGGLKIKGCMMSVFCATQTWTQTTNALPGQLVGMTGDTSGPMPDKEWAQPAPAKLPKTARAAK